MAAPRPASGRALRAVLEPGTVLAGRYRLTEPLPPALGDPDDATRWRALDDVLARPVDVLALLAGGRRAAAGRALLDAAAAAGAVVSPAVAQVYDAALEEVPAERYGRPAGGVDVAYVVSEALAGPRLAGLLAAHGPLDPDTAAALARQAAEGLRAAHARGVVHGGLHPGTLAVTLGGPAVGGAGGEAAGAAIGGAVGDAKLLDTAVGAALDRGRRTAPPDPADDVLALVGCLYAALTARWPERDVAAPSAGLPPAPLTGGRDGRTCSPRQVRAGVPRGLESVVVSGLAGRPSTADALLTALDRAADADAAARTPAPRRVRRHVPPRVQRAAWSVAVVALLVTVGAVSYGTGVRFGTVQDDDGGALAALVESTPSPVPGSSGTGERIDLQAAGTALAAFDPAPGDSTENDGAVPNSVDGDPATAWDTENYDTSRFGGLKAGVGLLVDLGSPTAVRQVEVGLRPGTDVELRAGDAPPASADDLPVVATVTDSDTVTRLVPDAPVTARFLLVWITRLPPDDGRFRTGISELQVVRD